MTQRRIDPVSSTSLTVFRLLTLYKLLAALAVLAAGGFLVVYRADAPDLLEQLASNLAGGRGVGALLHSGLLVLAQTVTPEGVTWIGSLLLIDGLILGVTAWALYRRSAAARPLVLAAIALPLAVEAWLIVSSFSVTLLSLLILNLLILAYVWRNYPRAGGAERRTLGPT